MSDHSLRTPTTLLRLALLLLTLGAVGCGERAAEYQTAVDTLSRRQKDSLLSTLPVPGAGAVGRALDASDLAAERASEHDAER